MDYTGSGELKSVLIHVIRGPSLVILKGNNYTRKKGSRKGSAALEPVQIVVFFGQ
jgi:hypothetical protein